jgi:hypothetical protein
MFSRCTVYYITDNNLVCMFFALKIDFQSTLQIKHPHRYKVQIKTTKKVCWCNTCPNERTNIPACRLADPVLLPTEQILLLQKHQEFEHKVRSPPQKDMPNNGSSYASLWAMRTAPNRSRERFLGKAHLPPHTFLPSLVDMCSDFLQFFILTKN